MSQYLEAMGIPIWSQKKPSKQASEIKPYWIKLDTSVISAENPSAHPIVISVLKLLNIGIDECTFSPVQPKGTELVWSLDSHRNANTEAVGQILVSESLSSLESSSDAKRKLWKGIYQLDALDD